MTSLLKKKFNRFDKVFFTIMPFILAYVFISAYFQFRKGDAQTEKLHKITADQILKIEVRANDNCNILIQKDGMESKESKLLFAKSMNELTKYEPNHDSHVSEFFIQMYDTNNEKYEFDVWIQDYSDETAYMHLVERNETGSSIKNLGGRKSASLYKWLEYYKFI